MAWSKHDTLAAAHGGAAVVVVFILIPWAVILVRASRTLMKVHMVLNVIAMVLLMMAVGMGFGAVMQKKDGIQLWGDRASLHHKLGVALFLLLQVQVAGGYFSRRHGGEDASGKQIRGKHWSRWLHMFAGMAVLAALYYQCYNGLFDEFERTSFDGRELTKFVKYSFWGLAAGPIPMYVAVWALQLLKKHKGVDVSLPKPWDRRRREERGQGGAEETVGIKTSFKSFSKRNASDNIGLTRVSSGTGNSGEMGQPNANGHFEHHHQQQQQQQQYA